MVAVIIGILLIAFAVFACAPFGLGWSALVITFLKGAAPVGAVFVGVIAILIGLADIKDRQEAKKEAAEE